MKQAQFDLGTAFLPANQTFGTPTGGANLVMVAQSSEEEALNQAVSKSEQLLNQ